METENTHWGSLFFFFLENHDVLLNMTKHPRVAEQVRLAVTLYIHTWKVPGSSLDSDTTYRGQVRDLFGSSRQMLEYYLDQATTGSFQIFSSSSVLGQDLKRGPLNPKQVGG